MQSLLWGFRAGGVITGEVQLGIIDIEIIPSVVGMCDITNGQGVYHEENGAKDRALRNATGEWMVRRFLARYCDALCPIREIGPQAVKGVARQTKMGVETVEENGVINKVKGH